MAAEIHYKLQWRPQFIGERRLIQFINVKSKQNKLSFKVWFILLNSKHVTSITEIHSKVSFKITHTASMVIGDRQSQGFIITLIIFAYLIKS